MMRNTRYLKPTASCHLTGKCWNGHTIITLDKQICSITKVIKRDLRNEGREPEQRKKEILECMRQFRLEEAEKEFRFDPKCQKERDEVFQYEQELRSMGLSEEIIIDH